MRWKKNQDGDKRTVKRFLLFPKSLPVKDSSYEETRWLEWTTIIQFYDECFLVHWTNWRWEN